MQDAPPPTVAAVEVVMPKLPAAASDAAFSVTRLGPEDIEGRDRIDQVLSQSPGTSLFRRTTSLAANPTTQGVSLRSIAPSGAGRALVLLDGVPQNDPFGGWVIWAGLPPELIDGVTLVRGGGSGPYGAGALTGVVSMDERARTGVEVDLRGGSLNSRRGAAVIEHNLGGLDVLLAVTGGETDGFIPVRTGRGAADTKLAERDASGTLRLTGAIGDTAVSVRVSAYDEDRESGLVGANARAQGSSASITFGQAPAGGQLGWRLQAWARESDLQNRSVAVAAGRTGTTPANDQYETPSTGYGFNAALRGGGIDREWEVGGDLRSYTGETRELFRFMAGTFTRNRIAGGDELVAGFYAEGTQTWGDWLATGGVRMDYWSTTNGIRQETDYVPTALAPINSTSPDRNGWVPTARAGLRRNFGETFVRGAAYAGFRPPTLNELHRPFRVGNDITEANPSLEPEKLYGLEAAAGWENDATRLSVTVFANKLEDAVTNVTVGAGPGTVPGFPNAGFIPAGGVLRQRQNAGVIEAIGVEAEAEHRYSDALRVRLAASYTDAEVDGGTQAPQLTGLRPAQAPRFTLTAAADWRPMDKLTLTARYRYEGLRFEDDQNSRRLPGAGSLDLRAAYAVRDDIEFYVSGENVLDEEVATQQTADGIFSYGPPATVNVGITFRR